MESTTRNYSDRIKGKMNPLVSKVHGKARRWSAEYAALRQLCLASGLNEELKWGQARYDLSGSNVVLIHGFKNYCALLFMKGALLKDHKGILIQQTKNVQAARQIRFASLADINKQKGAIKVYIRAAIAVEKSGAKVAMRSVAQFDAPKEFQERLDDDPKLAEAFHALTPEGRKAICCISPGRNNRRRAPRAWRNMRPGFCKGWDSMIRPMKLSAHSFSEVRRCRSIAVQMTSVEEHG